MNKNIIAIIVAVLFATTTMAQNSFSDKLGLAAGVTVSATGGLGGQIVGSYNNKLALRIGYQGFRYSPDKAYQYTFSEGSSDEVKLNIFPNVKLGDLSLLVDYYLLKSLYVTGGIVRTDFDVKAKIESAQDLDINNKTYTPEEIGELNIGVTTSSKVAPYLGLGFGRNISKTRGLTFNLEIGTMFTKSHKIEVSGTKHFEGNNDNESIQNLNKTLKDVSFAGLIPTIKIGFSYRFM